jgi:hypothetical protein
MESARTLLTLGDKEYGNAIGICIIHAVISANDAITIHLGEVRSSSEQHADAQRLLLEVAKKVPEKVLRAYASVVQAKFEYEYSGDVFTPSTARRLLVKAEVFYEWCRNNCVGELHTTSLPTVAAALFIDLQTRPCSPRHQRS